MLIFKAFQWVRHIHKFMFFLFKCDQKLMLFLMPPSGCFFLRFLCDLIPKCSILGGPRRPAKPKRTPRIAQVAPNSTKFLFCNCSARRVSNKPRSGEARGSIWDGFGPQCNVQRAPRATCNAPFSTCNAPFSTLRILEGFW